MTQLKRERKLGGQLERKVDTETEIGIEVEIFMALLSHIDSDHIFKTFARLFL